MPESAADHGLLLPVLGLAGRPGEAEARREVAVIADSAFALHSAVPGYSVRLGRTRQSSWKNGAAIVARPARCRPRRSECENRDGPPPSAWICDRGHSPRPWSAGSVGTDGAKSGSSVTGLPLESVTIWLPAISTGARPPRKLNVPLKPVGLVALVAVAAHSHAEADGVGAVRYRRVVLQLEMPGQVVRAADAIAAGYGRSPTR